MRRKEKGERRKNNFTPPLIFFFLFIIFSLSTTYSHSSGETIPKEKLNVLLISIDTLRADWLSCYGNEHLKTENIDGLAERGVLFSRAFANTSTTLPSHTNILLGVTPPYHGVHDNSSFVVREEFLTLAEHLKGHGYSTGAFVGAFALDSRFGLDQGFDVYDDEFEDKRNKKPSEVERKAEKVIDRTLAWLNNQNKPWFLFVHCWDPHGPYEPPEPFLTQYKEHPYTGEVAYVDFMLGKLFAYLEENNLFKETLVIFTGDHGESLGQHNEDTHGFFAYNTTIWIPLIVVSPVIERRRVAQYVSHIDIFPTVCEILRIEKPPFLQGLSLVPALMGKKASKRPIYFESLHPYYSKGWAPLRGFISNKEKYIQSPIPELYDLAEDFNELKNLAERKRLGKYEKELEQIINQMTSPDNKGAEKRLDEEALEKLRSLGYVSSSQDTRKENFTQDDDVKARLPYYNQAMKGLKQYEKGNKKQGFETLKALITERKDVAVAYINLASLYRKEKRLRDAVEVLKIGHENVPSNYLLFMTFINYLLDANQYDLIIRTFEGKDYRQMEYNPGIWNGLGIAYYKTGNLEKAIDLYEKVLSLNKDSPAFFTNFGEAQLSQGVKEKDKTLVEKALQNFQTAIKLDPDYALSYVGLGKAFRLLGSFDYAIASLRKALDLDDKLDEALYVLGLTYLDKGDKEKALSTLTLYKQKYYDSLPADLKQQLDDLIRSCREEKQ
jgi:arylsulfatase A-like enzyme/lipopolysaccharide biosynthesis regulator YciM